jgi:integration host factor subunit beta
MTKSQRIERVASRTRHISKRDIEVVVDTLFGSMTEVLVRGERIEIRGFGTFRVAVRKACQGFNPKTREPIQIPARRKAFFRVAKKLRERINQAPVPRSGEVAADAPGSAGPLRLEDAMNP